MNNQLYQANDTTLKSIWTVLETFIDPDTGVIYDTSLGRTELPTRAQVLDDIPNQCGWAAGFEDAALNAGLMLPFVIRLSQRTCDEKWKTIANQLADLLFKLVSVSDTSGFVARGVLPDGITYYRNSSTDQYTMVFYAMHTLCQWEHAGADHQKQAAQFVVDALALLERHQWNIPTADGEESWAGETAQFWPDRASRLLQFAVTDAVMNRSSQSLARYRALRDEAHNRRTRGLFSRPGATSVPYAVLQTQVSLRMLWEMEPDPEFKKVWLLSMHDLAENAILQLKARDLGEILRQIGNLPSLPEPIGVMEVYSEEDYGKRHSIHEVSDFGGRFWNTNIRVLNEQIFIRQPLELALCFALVEDKELVDYDGNLLLPTAIKYVEEILNAVDLNDIRLCHSAVSLFNSAAWINNL